ncbi:MAG: hypothetical protein KCHDKBKB_02992 [Elusimicrobia bacterium]|nr:hypothetical protein [Elusimicrobiota bacterium]
MAKFTGVMPTNAQIAEAVNRGSTIAGYEAADVTAARALLTHNPMDVLTIGANKLNYYYLPANADADNGTTVLKPNDVTSAGRWIATDAPLIHNHDGTANNGAKLPQSNTHETPDTDSSKNSLHHTLTLANVATSKGLNARAIRFGGGTIAAGTAEVAVTFSPAFGVAPSTATIYLVPIYVAGGTSFIPGFKGKTQIRVKSGTVNASGMTIECVDTETGNAQINVTATCSIFVDYLVFSPENDL